jgi:anti-sigma regulatory factor (Ser/Thr protein kinase)
VQEIGSCEVLDYVNTVTHGAASLKLRLRLRATPASASTLRAELRIWLWGLGASADEILDLQLACSEAVTMVIEQAATPVALIVDIEGKLEDAMVNVTIRDYGLCRQANRDGPETFSVALIQAVVDVFEVRAHADGRTIVLGRRLQCAGR